MPNLLGVTVTLNDRSNLAHSWVVVLVLHLSNAIIAVVGALLRRVLDRGVLGGVRSSGATAHSAGLLYRRTISRHDLQDTSRGSRSKKKGDNKRAAQLHGAR